MLLTTRRPPAPHALRPSHRVDHGTFERVSELVRRYGFITVMLARFVVRLRQLNGLVAGALSMPLTRFFPANIVGAGLWVTAWGLGPYLLGRWFELSHMR